MTKRAVASFDTFMVIACSVSILVNSALMGWAEFGWGLAFTAALFGAYVYRRTSTFMADERRRMIEGCDAFIADLDAGIERLKEMNP